MKTKSSTNLKEPKIEKRLPKWVQNVPSFGEEIEGLRTRRPQFNARSFDTNKIESERVTQNSAIVLISFSALVALVFSLISFFWGWTIWEAFIGYIALTLIGFFSLLILSFFK